MNWAQFKTLVDLATKAFFAHHPENAQAWQDYETFANELCDKYPNNLRQKKSFELYERASQKFIELQSNQVQAQEFKETMAEVINQAFGSKFSLNPEIEEADIVIVGGGPIGYAEAMGFTKLNPALKIVVLEKYPDFQRKHTLVMQPQQLEKLMIATGTTKDPELLKLLEQLKKNPHIRTNHLQEIFRGIAENAGVKTIIETVDPRSIEAQLLQFKPKLIIGADGTHSVVNDKLFPEANQIKHEVDFAMQVRHEVDGDPEKNWENSIGFFQSLARQGLVATEQIGTLDAKTKKTPVTVQLIIPKEDYLPLYQAKVTAKDPIRPFAAEDEKAFLIPRHLSNFIEGYFAEKVKKTGADPVDLNSIKVSVNELSASRADKVHVQYKGVNVCLNGDAALGLPYFKGFNAGLEKLAQFFTLLKPEIQNGLPKNETAQKLDDYQQFFNSYADKKIEEVKDYSAWKIKTISKVVKVVQDIKLSSVHEFEPAQKGIVNAYHRLHAGAKARNENIEFNPYPHRSYDPGIRLGQWAYVPITYTLKKILKLFIDYFKPYKSRHQFKDDFKQPMKGLSNFFVGLLKIIVGPFTLDFPRFADGIFTFLRGLLEIATAPLAYTLKPLMRGFLWLAFDSPTIEEGSGVQDLVEQGEEILAAQEDDDFSYMKMQDLLGLCNDLHRKFDKALHRGQETRINQGQESVNLGILHDVNKPLTRQKFRDYFRLYKQAEVGDLEQEESNEEVLCC